MVLWSVLCIIFFIIVVVVGLCLVWKLLKRVVVWNVLLGSLAATVVGVWPAIAMGDCLVDGCLLCCVV